MRLASSLLISAAFHGVVLTLPIFLLEAERKSAMPIPVILLDFGDGNGQRVGGRGGGEGLRGKPAGIYSNERPSQSQRSLKDNRNGAAASGETTPVSVPDLMAEKKTTAIPERNNLIETIASIGSISPPGLADEASGMGSLSGSPSGLEDGSKEGGAGGGGNSRTGMGAGRGSGGSVSGRAFYQANYAHTPKPGYPELARREGWEGTVLLRVLVNPQGTAERVEVNRSSGFEMLDRAALETVKGWRFHPARYGERQVESWVQIPIVFRLSDRDRGS